MSRVSPTQSEAQQRRRHRLSVCVTTSLRTAQVRIFFIFFCSSVFRPANFFFAREHATPQISPLLAPRQISTTSASSTFFEAPSSPHTTAARTPLCTSRRTQKTETMGGGNAQKSATARAKKQEKMKAESKGAHSSGQLEGQAAPRNCTCERTVHRRHFFIFFFPKWRGAAAAAVVGGTVVNDGGAGG